MAAVLLHDTCNIVRRLARLNSYLVRLAYTLIAKHTSTRICYGYIPAIYTLAQRQSPDSVFQAVSDLIFGKSVIDPVLAETSRATLLLQYKLMVRNMYGLIPTLVLEQLRSCGIDMDEPASEVI